jgi:hypothetical protein
VGELFAGHYAEPPGCHAAIEVVDLELNHPTELNVDQAG